MNKYIEALETLTGPERGYALRIDRPYSVSYMIREMPEDAGKIVVHACQYITPKGIVFLCVSVLCEAF